jgi:hypothetical protein
MRGGSEMIEEVGEGRERKRAGVEGGMGIVGCIPDFIFLGSFILNLGQNNTMF